LVLVEERLDEGLEDHGVQEDHGERVGKKLQTEQLSTSLNDAHEAEESQSSYCCPEEGNNGFVTQIEAQTQFVEAMPFLGIESKEQVPTGI